MNIKKYLSNIGFAAVFIFSLFSFASNVDAADFELSGSAWSGNVGWISFNCGDIGACGNGSFKVTVNDSTKLLSNYAWNDNLGWIHFDPTLASCPAGNTVALCAPKIGSMTSATTLSGFAKVLSGNGSTSLPGFSGFIDLSGVSVAAAGNSTMPRNMSGYAWGSDVVGWIDMSGVKISGSTGNMYISLSASKYVVSESSNQVLLSFFNSLNTSTTVAPTACTASKTVNGVSQAAGDGWVGSIVPSSGSGKYFTVNVGPSDAIYSIVCSNGTIIRTSSVSIKVSPTVTFTVDKNDVSYVVDSSKLPNPVDIKSLNAVNLTWSVKNATTCSASNTSGDTNWSGSLWSGSPSATPVSGSKNIYVGQYSNTYSLTCTNINNGQSVTFTQPVKVWNFMDNISANPNSVSYPSPNASNINFYTHKRVGTYQTNGLGNIGPITPASSVLMDSPTSTQHSMQSFVAQDTGPLRQIKIYYKANTAYKPYDLNVYIHRDNNGSLGGMLSSQNAVFPNPSAVWPSNSTTTYNWGYIPINNVNVVKGTKYWVRFVAPPSQWNHLYLASTPGGDFRVGLSGLPYSPSSNIYYKIFINNTVETPITGNMVACNASKTVNGIVQAVSDGWVASPMAENSGGIVSNSLAFYNKTFNVGTQNALYKVDCFNKLLPVETKSSTSLISVNNPGTLPSITSFIATPGSFSSTSGGNTTLSWTSVNTTSCNLARITPSFSDLGIGLTKNGNRPGVSVSANSIFRITCTDGVSLVSKDLSVNVGVIADPVIDGGLQATINPVPSTNRNTGLYWSTTNASGGCDIYRTSPSSVKLNNARLSANLTAPNAFPVSISSTGDSFMLECFNSANSSVTKYLDVTVTTIPPVPAVVKFGIGNVNTRNIEAVIGTTQTLFWEISGVSANSCRASTSPGSPWKSGNIIGNSSTPVTIRNTPGPQTFTLYNCLDMYGATVGPILVRVTAVNPTPIVTAWAFPANAKIYENVNLYWTSTFANSCAISNVTKNTSVASGQPAQMDNNSIGYAVSVSDPGPTIFRVTCSNPTKPGSDDVTVNFDPLTKKIKVIER
ncbi:MAG: hypothetical protein WC089_02265 [Candidatus Paceibacterota bacterium]